MMNYRYPHIFTCLLRRSQTRHHPALRLSQLREFPNPLRTPQVLYKLFCVGELFCVGIKKPISLVLIQLVIRQAEKHPCCSQKQLGQSQIKEEKKSKHAGLVATIYSLSGQAPNGLQKGKTVENKSYDSRVGEYSGADLIIGITEADTEQPVQRRKTVEKFLGVLI